MEESQTPLPEDHFEIDDEEIVMPDKRESNPYIQQDFSGIRLEPRY